MGDLTAREAEVLRAVLCGLTNKEIARLLGCSEGVVKNILTRGYRKIGARNRPHAAYILLGGK